MLNNAEENLDYAKLLKKVTDRADYLQRKDFSIGEDKARRRKTLERLERRRKKQKKDKKVNINFNFKIKKQRDTDGKLLEKVS